MLNHNAPGKGKIPPEARRGQVAPQKSLRQLLDLKEAPRGRASSQAKEVVSFPGAGRPHVAQVLKRLPAA